MIEASTLVHFFHLIKGEIWLINWELLCLCLCSLDFNQLFWVTLLDSSVQQKRMLLLTSWPVTFLDLFKPKSSFAPTEFQLKLFQFNWNYKVILESIKLKSIESLLARTSREFWCIIILQRFLITIFTINFYYWFFIRICQLLPAIWNEEVRRRHFYFNYYNFQLNLNGFISRLPSKLKNCSRSDALKLWHLESFPR